MNIWTGLLFLDGSLSDVGLVRELAADAAAPATASFDNEPAVQKHEARGVLDGAPSRRASPGIALR